MKTIAQFCAIAVLAGLMACSSEKKQAQVAPETVRDLAVLAVQPSTVPDYLEAVGTLRAAQSSQLASQVMGNVMQINVREGDQVRRGQVLATIDDAQPRAALERAQAAVTAAEHQAIAAEADCGLAQATLKRYQSLYEKKSASPQEFDEVKAREKSAMARLDMARSGHVQAKAALAQARTMFEYTRVRAPFDGVVTEKRADPGTLASPGMPLLTVEAAGRLRLEASVDESAIATVKLGAMVPITVDAVGLQEFTGKVVQIVPTADSASRTFIVKIEMPANPVLRSGLFGRARLARGQRESLLVPRTAVIDRGQLQGVYVLDKDKIAGLRYVTLGKAAGERVEVVSGLETGERIVAAPGPREIAGKRIEVQ
jgi:RND family efflux transporter MFP subunit